MPADPKPEEQTVRSEHAQNGDAMTLLVALVRLKGSASIDEVKSAMALLDDSALVRLRAKQQWEGVSTLAVLKDWGDPRDW